jgi:ATP-dependent exoDNAse (exonuclease V) alpha subunit
VLHQIDQSWIDLRAAYAQTINKSQGSTYDKVFIDLDNVSRCHVGDQIARMMYVGVSRARSQVIFTGDLV